LILLSFPHRWREHIAILQPLATNLVGTPLYGGRRRRVNRGHHDGPKKPAATLPMMPTTSLAAGLPKMAGELDLFARSGNEQQRLASQARRLRR
jgi:hypothetical protein